MNTDLFQKEVSKILARLAILENSIKLMLKSKNYEEFLIIKHYLENQVITPRG